MSKDTKPKLSCSFCRKSQDDVKKLIAGPGVYICDECVGRSNENLAKGYDVSEGHGGKQKCSFCGKLRSMVKFLLNSKDANPTVIICEECTDLCNEILEEELDSWKWPAKPSVHPGDQPRPENHPRDRNSIQGTLGEAGAAEFFSSLAANRKTGLLSVETIEGKYICIEFFQGMPIRARISNVLNKGSSALEEFLNSWKEGAFVFQEGAAADDLGSDCDVKISLERFPLI